MRFFAAAVCVLLVAYSHAYPVNAVDGSAVTSALNGLAQKDTRVNSKVVLDYQNMASLKDTTHDNAAKPLFTSVDKNLLQQPTYSTFINLLNFYRTTDSSTAQQISPDMTNAITAFMNAVFSTDVMIDTWKFLSGQGIASTQLDEFKQQVYNLWFQPYARGSVAGSSGFKSVYAGESANNEVTRFNNWLSFYELEASGRLNYHGWLSKIDDVQITLQFTLDNIIAPQKSFLLDNSPEFDFASATLCALSGTSPCNFQIGKNSINIFASVVSQNGYPQIDEVYSVGSSAAAGTTKKPNGNDPQLQDLVDQMWAADADKPKPGDITMDWGNKQSGNTDGSPNPLFTTVNEDLFNIPQYRDLITTYDKDLFNPSVCTAEPAMSGFRKQYLQAVFDTFTATPMFLAAFKYLQDKKVKNTDNIDNFKSTTLWNLWFGTYSRCKGALGSSGWEHVFSGEWKGTEVDGQHDWVRYYLLQKAGQMNYHGYYSHDSNLIGTFQYTWQNELKPKGGFFTGTSPAFDFSILTVCSLTHSGASACKFNLQGFPIYITSYTQACDSGTCLSTAYPSDTS